MKIRVLGLLGVMFLLISCGTKPKQEAETASPTVEKWSVRMANSIMSLSDTLLYYNCAIMPDRAFKMKWQYDVAMVGQAVDKLGKLNPKYSKYMYAYVDTFVNEDGSVKTYKMEEYNIDRINPAKNILTLYNRTGEEKYRKAIMLFVEQMRHHPKTTEGGYWHKKVYPSQIWLDGIYMGAPFLAEYAQVFNDTAWFGVVAKQFELAYKHTKDPETGLLRHAWDESRAQRWSDPKTGQAPNYWSRAIGWYVMSAVDVLDYFPVDHPKRDSIIGYLRDVCDALLKVRDPKTGMWYQVLDQGGKEGNYLEGSGSAMYIYAFAKGANKGYLDASYKTIAKEGFQQIIDEFITVNDDGTLLMKNICGGCGLGGNPYRDGSYDYYINETKVNNDTKGVAPFIMAALELDM